MVSDQENASNRFAKDIQLTLGHLRARYSQSGKEYLDLLSGTRHKLVESTDEVFAFSLGGGSFYEYETLQEVSVGLLGKEVSVIYGTDYVFRLSAFME